MDLACLVVQQDLVLQLALQFQVDLEILEDPEHQVAPSLLVGQHHLLVQLLQGFQENHCYLQDLEGHPCQEHHWVLGALDYPANNLNFNMVEKVFFFLSFFFAFLAFYLFLILYGIW